MTANAVAAGTHDLPKETPAALSGLMTTEEAAQYLRLTPGTLIAWRCVGRRLLPFVKVGRYPRYRRQDLDAFIAANLRSGAAS